jgi:hypothetical protein
MNEVEVRVLIREQLRAGTLPRGPGGKTFAGHGEDNECDCCGCTILRREVTYEVAGADGSETLLVAHLRCHAIWMEESARLGAEPSSGLTAASSRGMSPG